jgi:hypothetical protein
MYLTQKVVNCELNCCVDLICVGLRLRRFELRPQSCCSMRRIAMLGSDLTFLPPQGMLHRQHSDSGTQHVITHSQTNVIREARSYKC